MTWERLLLNNYRMKKGITLLVFVLSCSALVAQGRKDVTSNKVKSQTVEEYFLSEGRKEPVIEQVQVYDTAGNVVELKEYNSEGVLKNWQRFEYDANGDVTMEESLDVKGKVIERTEMDYKNGLITEKRYFDRKLRLVKKKVYVYEYRD